MLRVRERPTRCASRGRADPARERQRQLALVPLVGRSSVSSPTPACGKEGEVSTGAAQRAQDSTHPLVPLAG